MLRGIHSHSIVAWLTRLIMMNSLPVSYRVDMNHTVRDASATSQLVFTPLLFITILFSSRIALHPSFGKQDEALLLTVIIILLPIPSSCAFSPLNERLGRDSIKLARLLIWVSPSGMRMEYTIPCVCICPTADRTTHPSRALSFILFLGLYFLIEHFELGQQVYSYISNIYPV